MLCLFLLRWGKSQKTLCFTGLLWGIFAYLAVARSGVTRQYEVQEAVVNYVEAIISHPGVSGVRLRTPAETSMPEPWRSVSGFYRFVLFVCIRSLSCEGRAAAAAVTSGASRQAPAATTGRRRPSSSWGGCQRAAPSGWWRPRAASTRWERRTWSP